ncbi:hypothetical protein CAEBREN_12111 [Caenorhabditis brenneri]|uniref:Uncharacterized protein n=1 Tax=Caenorhabditis brenneri TaxID=135651 RepID=G0PBG4_CAEBE|nr:hypothetical protein CAEBREN_12111 [Caenorhabditis brenneri]
MFQSTLFVILCRLCNSNNDKSFRFTV